MCEAKAYARLDELERCRQAEQRAIERAMPEVYRRRWGQFATPPGLATAILRTCRQVLGEAGLVRFLDPGGGTGVFFRALLEVFGPRRVNSAVSYEVLPVVAAAARRLWSDLGLQVRCEDFTRARPECNGQKRPNLIVCNPPYSRHHGLSRETKVRLGRRTTELTGVEVDGLAGLHVYFMLLADQWLDEGGLGAWLIPSETLDVNYGAAIRRYLSSRVSLVRIHRFPPTSVQFDQALVSSCVILFRKERPHPSDIATLTWGADLEAPDQVHRLSIDQLCGAPKWGKLMATSPELGARTAGTGDLTIGDLFQVRRGIATGANRFFVLERQHAAELELPAAFLRPILPSPRYIEADVVEADEEQWPLVEPSLALLNCDLPRRQVERDYLSLEAYLVSGERMGLHQRYLLSRRSPWYRQETRPPAPLLCTYMARRKLGTRTFRFIRNRSDAIALNVYLMMYPKRVLQAAGAFEAGLLDRVHDALRQLSDAACVREGREYGGGLHKLEPSELCRLPVPLADEDRRLLARADQLVLPGL